MYITSFWRWFIKKLPNIESENNMIVIQNTLRAGHVPRWQLCDTTRTQSIAEHMFNCAFIVRHMCEFIGIRGDEQNGLVIYALKHDLDEVITGDMPTVTKERLRNRGCEPNGLINSPDLVISDEFARQMVKMADLIESAWWIGEHGVGRHAKKVAEITEQRLRMKFTDNDIHEAVRQAGIQCWDQIQDGELTI